MILSYFIQISLLQRTSNDWNSLCTVRSRAMHSGSAVLHFAAIPAPHLLKSGASNATCHLWTPLSIEYGDRFCNCTAYFSPKSQRVTVVRSAAARKRLHGWRRVFSLLVKRVIRPPASRNAPADRYRKRAGHCSAIHQWSWLFGWLTMTSMYTLSRTTCPVT